MGESEQLRISVPVLFATLALATVLWCMYAFSVASLDGDLASAAVEPTQNEAEKTAPVEAAGLGDKAGESSGSKDQMNMGTDTGKQGGAEPGETEAPGLQQNLETKAQVDTKQVEAVADSQGAAEAEVVNADKSDSLTVSRQNALASDEAKSAGEDLRGEQAAARNSPQLQAWAPSPALGEYFVTPLASTIESRPVVPPISAPGPSLAVDWQDRQPSTDEMAPSAQTDFLDPPPLIREHFLDDPVKAAQRPGLSAECNIWNGRWVYDESYPLWDWKEYAFKDDEFNCPAMGRKDLTFMKFRWQPHDCNIPRFDAADFRRRMRGRRLAFVGDSLGRNQFVSLLSMAAHGADVTKIYERARKKISPAQESVGFVFKEYNFTLEYYRSYFLAAKTRARKGFPRNVEYVLKLDVPDSIWSKRAQRADILVFNVGHWLNDDKIKKKKTRFAVNNSVLGVGIEEAFGITLRMLGRWVEELPNPATQVFFRSYSSAHFEGGDWKTGGQCTRLIPQWDENEVQDVYFTLGTARAIGEMQRPMTLLNITALSDLRSDGHMGKRIQKDGYDCSHWCLPGVPDIWNELLYATLLAEGKPPFD